MAKDFTVGDWFERIETRNKGSIRNRENAIIEEMNKRHKVVTSGLVHKFNKQEQKKINNLAGNYMLDIWM